MKDPEFMEEVMALVRLKMQLQNELSSLSFKQDIMSVLDMHTSAVRDGGKTRD